jgi:NADH-quinone oxidoreductase subunit L
MHPVTAALFLPLLGAILVRSGSARMVPAGAARLASSAVGLAHLFSWVAFFMMLGYAPEARIHDLTLFPLLQVGNVGISFLLRWDPLSQLMLMVVTGVAFLIHLYSASYMEGDERYPYFFADLNLFVFSMLLLVLAGNFLLLFAGWEMVGLCSYLLIGFWGSKPSAAAAGLKAFVVNRIGDAGFILAILMMAAGLGTLDYTGVFSVAPSIFLKGSGAALALALFLFCGAMGKSAQFPLHVWLPDAMEGPTPVSALIHAATMVTAGVYMVCRCHTLFELAPASLQFVAWTGAFTAVFAGTIALAQRDLKRILAFSTVSQLGLMFLAAGVGAYGAAMFHLFTHAFFKALLFLGAGAVMHALAGELDVWKMGGLARPLRWTFWTFLAGSLALAGAPLTAGFFSKDRILFSAFLAQPNGRALWLMGLTASVLTGLYIFRAVWLVFAGKPRVKRAHEPHDAPPLMRWPLVVLAVFSLLAGFLWMPGSWSHFGPFGRFLEPVLGLGEHFAPPGREEAAMAFAVAAFLAGLGLAWGFYRRGAPLARKIGGRLKPLHRVLFNKYWVDEAYRAAVVKPLFQAASRMEEEIDRGGFDGTAEGFAETALESSGSGRKWQTGHTGHYALAMALGAAALAVLVFLVQTWVMP